MSEHEPSAEELAEAAALASALEQLEQRAAGETKLTLVDSVVSAPAAEPEAPADALEVAALLRLSQPGSALRPERSEALLVQLQPPPTAAAARPANVRSLLRFAGGLSVAAVALLGVLQLRDRLGNSIQQGEQNFTSRESPRPAPSIFAPSSADPSAPPAFMPEALSAHQSDGSRPAAAPPLPQSRAPQQPGAQPSSETAPALLPAPTPQLLAAQTRVARSPHAGMAELEQALSSYRRLWLRALPVRTDAERALAETLRAAHAAADGSGAELAEQQLTAALQRVQSSPVVTSLAVLCQRDLLARLAMGALREHDYERARHYAQGGLALYEAPDVFQAQLLLLRAQAFAALGARQAATSGYAEALRIADTLTRSRPAPRSR